MRARALTHVLGAGLCVWVVGLLMAPAFASAGGVLNACGPHLERVKEFKGHASLTFESDAQGEFPGTNESESITMQHNVLGVEVHMKRVEFAHGRAVFEGPATGGGVGVHDLFVDENGGFGGFLKFEGSLSKKGRARGQAFAVFNRHKDHCVYSFGIGWHARADYMGPPEVEPGDRVVGGASLSTPEKIPSSLKLSGDQGLPTFLSCFNGRKDSCSDISGGWTTDFGTLALCHSVEAVNCEDDVTTPVGAAAVNWFVTPVFEK